MFKYICVVAGMKAVAITKHKIVSIHQRISTVPATPAPDGCQYNWSVQENAAFSLHIRQLLSPAGHYPPKAMLTDVIMAIKIIIAPEIIPVINAHLTEKVSYPVDRIRFVIRKWLLVSSSGY